MSVPYACAAGDDYTEPGLTRDQLRELLDTLPAAIANGLRQRLNNTLSAQAPWPFSDALGELEAYLDGLDDAALLPFAQQIQLKDYVMQGWRDWRAGFAALRV
jgi:hypothetical protein